MGTRAYQVAALLLSGFGAASAEPVESRIPRNGLVVYDCARHHFYLVKDPSANKLEIYAALKSPDTARLSDTVASSAGSTVAVYVANFNSKLFAAKVDSRVEKTEEKVPDLIKSKFGDLTQQAGFGNATPINVPDLLNSLAGGKTKTGFEDAYGDFKIVVQFIDDQTKSVVGTVKDAFDTAATYDAFAPKVRQAVPGFKAVSAGVAESALNNALIAVQNLAKEDPVNRAAAGFAAALAETSRESIKSYGSALAVYGKTVGQGGYSPDQAFAEYFITADAKEVKVEGDATIVSVSLSASSPASVPIEPSGKSELRIENASARFRFAFSTGYTFFNVGDGSYGKDDVAGSDLKRIASKGAQQDTLGEITQFVHALYPFGSLWQYGPSFGLAQRDDKLCYFGGLTASYGRSQRILATIGVVLAPTRRLDGIGVGDTIGASTTIPTKYVNRTSLFVGISLRY